MSMADYIKENERIYNGAVDVKYFYIPPVEPSEKLIIIFSGFHGKEGQGRAPSYNYVNVLSQVDCHRLFILDSYNGHPCYYLGKNQNLDYELSTMSLIYEQLSYLNIRRQDVITCGSSKGGTAALYFALKYNLGSCVVGGFQSYVGSYIRHVNYYAKERVLRLITGGVNQSHEDYLNDFYHHFFKNVNYKNTDIYIHGGKNDPHYLNHVVPITKIFDERDIPYTLDLKDYNSHAVIGEFFSEFLLKQIPQLTKTLLIKEVRIDVAEDSIFCKPIFPDAEYYEKDIKFAYYIFSSDAKEPLAKIGYSNNKKLNYKIGKKGKYRVKVFARNGNHKTSKLSKYISLE